jgi:heme/copper-type cytochrome/quinol oxidase subunit 2
LASRHRTRRKQYKPWGRQATLELVICAFVLVALIATAVVFLFVYHDFPFRFS